jgi:hypothetical protein
MKFGKKTPTPKYDDKLTWPEGRTHSSVPPADRYQCPAPGCDAIWFRLDGSENVPHFKEHKGKLVYTGLSNTPKPAVVK